MRLSHKNDSHNKIEYFPLPCGKVDVFLHKNEIVEIDEDENKVYVAEEVYFQVGNHVRLEDVEEDFEKYWINQGELTFSTPSTEDRVDELENILLMVLGGEI